MAKPIVVEKLKTLRRFPRAGVKNDPDEVAFLHSLLNHHLPKPDDQLPIENEPGASEFGPRTEAKVKKFQEVNKIDIGTPFFKDGVVGPNTWKVLNSLKQVIVPIVVAPELHLTPPTPPGGSPPRPPTFFPATTVT